MIDYPPDFPAAARAVVERALADAEDEFVAASAGAGPIRSGVLPGDITYPGMWDTSDRAAMWYVIEVFAAIVEASCAAARKGHWRAEQLRATTANLLAQLIELAYRQKHSKGVGGFGPVTVDDFTTIVYRELRALGFWSELQDTIRELAKNNGQTNDSAGIEPTSAPTILTTKPPAVPGQVERLMPDHDAHAGAAAKKALRARRYARIDAYQRTHGLSDRGLFCKDVGISTSTLGAIVRDEKTKYSPDVKVKLLAALGVSTKDWDSLQ